jgi:hypothetical protein
MTKKQFHRRIKNMQFDEDDEKSEWWSKSNHATYAFLGDKLVEEGLSFDLALSILGDAYRAAAGEFGM